MPTADQVAGAPFILLTELQSHCLDAFGVEIDPSHLQALVGAGLLPVFRRGNDGFVLGTDVRRFLRVLSFPPGATASSPAWDGLFPGLSLSEFQLSSSTRITRTASGPDPDPALHAAIPNLAHFTSTLAGEESGSQRAVGYLAPYEVVTSSGQVAEYAKRQRARIDAVLSSKASQFASSAYYMGSKRALAGFLVEAVASVLHEDGTVVDLMCGSGAAASAFSRNWRTIASDAQEFCRILAAVQGRGLAAEEAEQVLAEMLPVAREHAGMLRARLSTFVDWEDRLLHGDLGPQLLGDYRDFVSELPTYPSPDAARGWCPSAEIGARKLDPNLAPFCLFTAYFANVYFGLRQSIEVDSLRFAIDRLDDPRKQRWALGALIATLSKLGTTYAGHFAQPVVKTPSDIKDTNLPRLLETRAASIMHEFSIRLLNLAKEGELAPRPIELVEGPWRNALSSLDKMIGNEPVVVYVDAPYKREEYSRYYHVLETLVTYSYPSCVGRGKIPDKRKGERFGSEFFTKNCEKFLEALVEVIAGVLARGWTCAWSYSDTGSANIVAAVERLSDSAACGLRSYATPYEHKSQGKRRRRKKEVTEYLVLFTPR